MAVELPCAVVGAEGELTSSWVKRGQSRDRGHGTHGRCLPLSRVSC
jgi:hypothetical protein